MKWWTLPSSPLSPKLYPVFCFVFLQVRRQEVSVVVVLTVFQWSLLWNEEFYGVKRQFSCLFLAACKFSLCLTLNFCADLFPLIIKSRSLSKQCSDPQRESLLCFPEILILQKLCCRELRGMGNGWKWTNQSFWTTFFSVRYEPGQPAKCPRAYESPTFPTSPCAVGYCSHCLLQ